MIYFQTGHISTQDRVLLASGRAQTEDTCSGVHVGVHEASLGPSLCLSEPQATTDGYLTQPGHCPLQHRTVILQGQLELSGMVVAMLAAPWLGAPPRVEARPPGSCAQASTAAAPRLCPCTCTAFGHCCRDSASPARDRQKLQLLVWSQRPPNQRGRRMCLGRPGGIAGSRLCDSASLAQAVTTCPNSCPRGDTCPRVSFSSETCIQGGEDTCRQGAPCFQPPTAYPAGHPSVCGRESTEHVWPHFNQRAKPERQKGGCFIPASKRTQGLIRRVMQPGNQGGDGVWAGAGSVWA